MIKYWKKNQFTRTATQPHRNWKFRQFNNDQNSNELKAVSQFFLGGSPLPMGISGLFLCFIFMVTCIHFCWIATMCHIWFRPLSPRQSTSSLHVLINACLMTNPVTSQCELMTNFRHFKQADTSNLKSGCKVTYICILLFVFIHIHYTDPDQMAPDEQWHQGLNNLHVEAKTYLLFP